MGDVRDVVARLMGFGVALRVMVSSQLELRACWAKLMVQCY